MTDSEQEGFYKQQLSIFLEEAVYELFVEQSSKKLLQPQPSAFEEEPQLFALLNGSKLIDHSLREEWLKSIYLSDREKVIFCNIKGTKYFSKRNKLISFSSMFESGNLDLVLEVKPSQYHLYLRPDTNVIRPCQWFNFKCKCSLINTPIKFKICNLKEVLLYQQGLRPYVKRENQGWAQIQSNLEYSETSDGFSITFYYQFRSPEEVVQFAGSPPYTVADLSEFIHTLSENKTIKLKTMCTSALKIPIKYLEIGACKDFKSSVGLAIARQHPGETSGSYVVQGFIKHLVEVSDPSIMWIIVPMVNVDGVYIGNNRHNIAGYDLNRTFNSEDDVPPEKENMIPEVRGIIKLIKQMKSRFGKRFRMFLDFHGHSTMPCSFSYGPQIAPHDTSLNALESRLFPELISTHNQNFKTGYCSYTIKKHKENAARSILFKKFKVPFSYTIETSYGLGDKNKKLSVKDFVEIGVGAAKGAIQFMRYLNQKEQPLLMTKGTNALSYCKSLMEKIKEGIINDKDGNGVEIDSSDEEEQKMEEKMEQRTMPNSKETLKITSKKLKMEKLVKYRKLAGTQDNRIQPIIGIPKILIQSANVPNTKLNIRKSIISKRGTISEQGSILKRYQTVTGRNSCLQKDKNANFRIKKMSTLNMQTDKQAKSKSVYHTREKSKSSVNPVLIFY